MVRQGNNPALLARVFRAIDLTFSDAIKKWRLMQEFKRRNIQCAIDLSEDTMALRAFFAGGIDVNCDLTTFDEDGSLYLYITFKIPGDPQRYGSHLVYPDGENSHL